MTDTSVLHPRLSQQHQTERQPALAPVMPTHTDMRAYMQCTSASWLVHKFKYVRLSICVYICARDIK